MRLQCDALKLLLCFQGRTVPEELHPAAKRKASVRPLLWPRGLGLRAQRTQRVRFRHLAKKTSRDKRLKFFNLGNTHCPICLVQFTEENVRTGRGVTLEHAPPKTLGGREVCLTCEPCNSLASGSSDQAVKRSKSPPELQFDISGTRRSARFWPDGIPPSRMPYGFGIGAAAKKAQRELSKQTIVAVTGPIQFDQPTTIKEVSVSLKRPNPRHVELSYLRSAYLLVFSLLGRNGYVYAQSEAARLIRVQILNPNGEVGASLVRAFASERPLGVCAVGRFSTRRITRDGDRSASVTGERAFWTTRRRWVRHGCLNRPSFGLICGRYPCHPAA